MILGNFYDSTRININLGDYLQFIAINNVYQHMGITKNDIHYIDFPDVINYSGEQMILPINYSINDFTRYGEIRISPHITPVFIALQLDTVDPFMSIDKFLSNLNNQRYLLQHAPVGCRNITTYRYLTKYRIPAYVNGCMTATLPMHSGKRGQKIIFVDAPDALLPHIPDAILRQPCEAMTQQYHFTQQEIYDFQSIYSFVKSQYAYYCENAKLVVTSRLHVALPCAAFGIPVILAKDYVDTRLDFVEQYIPIYNLAKYAEIDWSPAAINFEPLKRQMISLAAKRIESAMTCVQQGNAFTDMFLAKTRTIEEYADPHLSFHKNGNRFETWALKYWKTGPRFYALWGVSEDSATYWKNLIQTKYPDAELVAIYDRYKSGNILGMELRSPDDIAGLPKNIAVLVCAVGATTEARRMFRNWGWGAERYCITADCFISAESL